MPTNGRGKLMQSGPSKRFCKEDKKRKRKPNQLLFYFTSSKALTRIRCMLDTSVKCKICAKMPFFIFFLVISELAPLIASSP
jgi:hypothetical protein